MIVFICLGEPPVAGCGRVLTKEEQHYYGHACEDCTRKWDDAIDEWRKGGENNELRRHVQRWPDHPALTLRAVPRFGSLAT